ncbi:MAG: hypothetical protein E7583_05475 [Ruminococcaceae bacterium]|nr:hypothetical protein [Oscillospiraceae bacterium]
MKKKVFLWFSSIVYIIPFSWILLCSEVNYTFSVFDPEMTLMWRIICVPLVIIGLFLSWGIVYSIGMIITMGFYYVVFGEHRDSDENKEILDKALRLQIPLSFVLFMIIMLLDLTSFVTIKLY